TLRPQRAQPVRGGGQVADVPQGAQALLVLDAAETSRAELLCAGPQGQDHFPPFASNPMTRRVFTVCLLALAISLVLATAAPAAPPNVVILLSDDQAWSDYGFMGHPQIQTPRLDRLASQSVVFTRGYTPTSLCRPSL